MELASQAYTYIGILNAAAHSAALTRGHITSELKRIKQALEVNLHLKGSVTIIVLASAQYLLILQFYGCDFSVNFL